MNKLEAFWTLRLAAETAGAASYDFEHRTFSGKIDLNPEIKAAIGVVDEAGDLSEIQINYRYADPQDLPIQGTITFTAKAPVSYFENIDELISRHPITPPQDLKIFDIDDSTQRLPLYYQAANLASLLKRIAVSSDHQKVTLYSKNSLEIPLSYSSKDLQDLPLLNEILGQLESSPGQSPSENRLEGIYREFFIHAIYDVLSSVAKDRRLPHLLDHFEECVFRFRQSFRAYSDEGNKAIERYEEKRAAIITSLNGILGTIQASLIGIPLAGILALKEMKATTGEFSYENTIIFFAVLIIGLLLIALTMSQGKALGAIDTLCIQLKADIANSGEALTRTRKSLDSMDTHYKWVKGLLIAIRIIIGAFIAGAILAYLKR